MATDTSPDDGGSASADTGAIAGVGTPAGFWPRAGAALIDGLLIGIPLNILFYGPMSMGGGGLIFNPLAFLVMAVAYLGYKVYMEASEKGATVGKMVLKIKVVGEDGKPLDYKSAAMRSAPYWAPPALGVLSFWLYQVAALVALASCISVAFRDHYQGFHDTFAKAMVVKA